MKNIIAYLMITALFLSCSSTIQKNKKVIDGLVSARQVANSVKVDKYTITHYDETSDSLIVYVDGQGADNKAFLDTLRLAKNADGTVAIKNNLP